MTFIHAKFKLKRENAGPQHRLTKCAIENKLPIQNCWSWYNFCQEKIPHPLIPVSTSTYYGKYAILFLLGPPDPCIIIICYLLFLLQMSSHGSWVKIAVPNWRFVVLICLLWQLCPLGKALYPHCLVPHRGLKVVDQSSGCLLISSLLSLLLSKINKFP